MEFVIPQPPMNGEEFLAELGYLLSWPELGTAQKRTCAVNIEHPETVPQGIGIHKLIVSGYIELAQRPRENCQSFQPPTELYLAALFELSRRALNCLPFLGLKFVL